MADVTAIQEAASAMELAQLSLGQARTAELSLHKALAKAKARALVWRPIAGPDPTWQMTAAAIIGLYENALHEAGCEGCAVKANPVTEFHLNKITHRLRFADEDEFSARVIIEPKAGRELTSAEWKMIAEDPDLGDQYHG